MPYHGSSMSGIKTRERCLRFMARAGSRCISRAICHTLSYTYGTSKKAGARVKRITCGILRGVVYCEERFANQLEEFYGVVAGYVYRVENTPDFAPVSGREDMFYSSRSASVKDVLRVDDVYEALLDYERQGSFKLLRFSDASAEKREKLIDSDASYILDNGMLTANTEQAAFMRRYFTDAWERALA